MSIKESLKNVAADLEVNRQNYLGNMIPRYEGALGDIGGYIGRMRNMATDESQRGYSDATVNAMRAAATGALTGARRSALENVNKNIAASGMGNTGMGIRQARSLGRDFMTQQREANRDVDLAQAEAKRNDLWSAIQAENQGYNTQGNYLGGLGDVYNRSANMLSQKTAPLMGAHDVSFWGPNPLSQQIFQALL